MGLCQGIKRQPSYRSVTRGAKCFRHSLFGPSEDVAAGSHRSSNQHRLTCELIGAEQTTAAPLNLLGMMG